MSTNTIKWGPIGEQVYQRTYSRVKTDGTNETWPETVQRVVRGNTANAPLKAGEAERLAELILPGKALPAGRHLWITGTGLPFTRNCFRAPWTSRLADHYEFMADQLLTGGGVGANYSQEYIRQSPTVESYPLFITCSPAHPEYQLVKDAAGAHFIEDWEAPDTGLGVRFYRVPDMREGWARGWGDLFDVATGYRAVQPYVALDVTDLRPSGAIINTFGGTASGPEPFVRSVVNVYSVLMGAVGRHLSATEAMLCDHRIAQAVVAGGARRSARMSIVHWKDPDIFSFIECKANHMEHWTTNISVEIDDEFISALSEFDPHATAVFKRTVAGMWANGEPGFYNVSLSQVGERGDVRSTNPCVAGDTLVMTSEGLRRADSLLGRKTTVVVDNSEWDTTDEGFFLTGTKDTLVLDVDGTSLTVTTDHPIMTVDGWVHAGDLSVGDSVVLGNGAKRWSGRGTEADGYVLGHLVGDGTFVSDKAADLCSWGTDTSVRAYLTEITGKEWGTRSVEDDKWGIRIKADLPALYGIVRGNKTITDEVMTASSVFTVGFLSGLFDTDGHVEGHPKKGGVSIRLSQSDEAFLGRVKTLLQAHGVRSVVRNMKPADQVQFKKEQKFYDVKASYRLVIAGDSVQVFLDRIGFKNSDKQAKAESLVSQMSRGFYSKPNVSSIRSITSGPTIPVYDCQVPGINAFEANGVVVSNCGEIPLEEGESCNIGSIDLGAFGTDDAGAEEAFRLMARFLIRATLVKPYQELTATVEARNRRIGVGFLGLQGWAAAHGVKYSDIPTSGMLGSKLYAFKTAIREEADRYCDELGITRCIKVTAIAPNGTISQLFGTQAGGHAILARHAWRRVRYTFGDARIVEAQARGLLVEPCVYAANTMVVRYPLRDVILDRFPEHLIQQTSDVSLNDQLAVLSFITDTFCSGNDGNAVSFTANLDRSEFNSIADVERVILSWLPKLKGCTVFPTESRPQSPYEIITKAEYEIAAGGQDFTGQAEVDCSATGSCPIR